MTTPPPPQGQNPYAQPTAPTGQQQPGQPGVPPQQPYAPFPNQGGAPVPPPPAPAGKRMGKKAIRIIGAIVVAVIIGILKFGAGWFLTRDDAETTSVGACMYNEGTDTNADLNEVGCTDSKAQYKVVEKFDGSSDDSKCEAVTDATISYVQYGGGHDVVLCLKEVK
ncbi:LppU/SCO3897 family protein [Streptomyces sp. T028]|uniref:LppU/SCO3897 family protein n=1 Tax=Streptomyces sp. T028 TaxID=3394379 RepID=UPI003A8A9396